MTIVVPGCRILVKPDAIQEDEVTKAAKAIGIQIYHTQEKEKEEERKRKVAMDKGIVLQIGPAVNKDFIQGLKVGDKIGFAKFGGKFITDPQTQEQLLILNDEDVVCIFKD